MQSVGVPFPCVVYTKQQSAGPQHQQAPTYTFSHHCSFQTAQKMLPKSLRVSDLRAYDHALSWAHLSRACFLVLVAGDTAQCVSIANASEAKQRVRFLYRGSAFARPAHRPESTLLHSELSEAYVPLHFHGTMAVYDRFSTGVRAVIPLESGIALFPRQIAERDIALLARWVTQCARRSLQASVWLTNNGDSYSEATLQLRRRQPCSSLESRKRKKQ